MTLIYSSSITKKETLAVFVRIDNDKPKVESFNEDVKEIFSKLVDSGIFSINMKYMFSDYKDLRIMFVTYREVRNYTEETWRVAGANLVNAMKDNRVKNIEVDMSALFAEIASDDSYKAFCSGIVLANYSFTKYFSKDRLKNIHTIKTITLVSDDKKNTELAISISKKEYDAVSWARNMVNEPSNFINAKTFVDEAKKECLKRKIKTTVLDKKKIEALKMGGLLGVNAGSKNPPFVFIAEYKNPKAKKNILVIGKGITFDTGGMDLKPSDSMLNMKDDLGGAAAACASLFLASDFNVQANITVIAMLTDNKTGSGAINPSDILKMYDGTTVEIISTDAEGRLILADGLSYGIEKYKPDYVIDIATLTGAASVALGTAASGLYGNDEKLLSIINEAGIETYERVWEMPNFEEYRDLIKSDIADIKNSSGRKGGVMIAGAFLEHFVGDSKWAHIDIACTGFLDKATPYTPVGGTGVGTRLITRTIEKLAE